MLNMHFVNLSPLCINMEILTDLFLIAKADY